MERNLIAKELLKVAKLISGYDSRSMMRKYRREQLNSAAEKVTFHFRTKAMEDLWNEELTGQISDGAWENTEGTGWEFWGGIKTAVGGKTRLEGELPYRIKRGFGFARALIDVIGDRMLELVQKTEPHATMDTVRDYCNEIAEAMRHGEAVPRGGTESLGKDEKRIKDMVTKSNGDEAKLVQLATNMAKAITDPEKAVRRAKAAEKAGLPKVAEIFMLRAKQLL